MALSSSNKSVDISLSSFGISLSSSSGISDENDKDDSSSFASLEDDSDTQCSSPALLESRDTEKERVVSTKNNVKSKGPSISMPSPCLSLSLASHKERNEPTQSRRRLLSLSSSSTSTSEQEKCDLTISESSSMASSYPWSRCSSPNVSLSLPSPTCLKESEMAGMSPALSACPLPVSVHADQERDSSVAKTDDVSVHKSVKQTETKEQQCSSFTTKMPNLEIHNTREHTQGSKKDTSIDTYISSLHEMSIHELEREVASPERNLESPRLQIPPPSMLISPIKQIQSTQVISCPHPLSPIAVNPMDCNEECPDELPSTSSFHADAETFALRLDLPAPPPRGDTQNWSVATLSRVKLEQVGIEASLESQPAPSRGQLIAMTNSFFLDDGDTKWEHARRPSNQSSEFGRHFTAQNSPCVNVMNSIDSPSLCSTQRLVEANNQASLAARIVNSPQEVGLLRANARKKEVRLQYTQHKGLYGRDHQGVRVSDERNYVHAQQYNKENANDQRGKSRSRKQDRGIEAKARVEHVSIQTTAEANRNVVKSAERLTMNNVRAYYIKKIQEIEAAHQSQLAAIKAPFSLGRENGSNLKQERETRLEVKVGSTEKTTALETRKRVATRQKALKKDIYQQTDPSLESLTPTEIGANDQAAHAVKCQELQSCIEKLTAEALLKEKIVASLKEQLNLTSAELQSVRQELLSKSALAAGAATMQPFDPINIQNLRRSLEISQVKNIQLKNQVDNLQSENDRLQLQLSSATCVSESNGILAKYSSLSRKISELEQRAIRREEEIQATVIEIQRKTAVENQRLQSLHEDELREKDEKLRLLRRKLDGLMKGMKAVTASSAVR